MRVVAVLLMVLCLAAVGLTGYVYLTANVIITGIDCVAADAADQTELFQELKREIGAEAFTGTPFETRDLGEAGDYQFYTYRVQLRNDTFVRAEVAQIQISPMNGDVLQTPETGPREIPPRGTGEIQGTILTGKDMHNVREILVTYYLWGLPFSIRTTYSR